MKFYRAVYVSAHFEFEAYGKSETEALDTMRKTLRAHAKQVGIAPDWFHPVEDIGVYPIEIGKGLRDREPIG